MKTLHTATTGILLLLFITTLSLHAQELYVGANYHPHDLKDAASWERDIQLMKEAGFKMVRMGHLAWDSYEPSEGVFDFEWFDTVMTLMNKADIKVILDIAVRPAPIWLQNKYPSVNITDKSGNQLYPNHRYMEDVGDPNYQKYALRYADTLTKRYANHPALAAFGIDNEPGDGSISYSETVRKRFVSWLKKKYTTTDNLNKAWEAQRWSRKINAFNEVGLPVSGSVTGPPERVLDFRLFLSDEINQFLMSLIETVNNNAPKALTTTNMWYYSDKKYFDYADIAYSGKMTRGGCGYYFKNTLINNKGNKHASFGMARIQFENNNPFWCTEFTTMTATPKSIRKSAYISLIYGNQLVCGWTWQTMHGGEEQFLEGMLDWDGVPNRKYDEYKQIASEFNKIEKYGFPYQVKADIALAFSFPSQIASYTYPVQHDNQLESAFNILFDHNLDTRVVDIKKSELDYKLLIIPGVAVMDEATSLKIRDYIHKGGTVIMTAYSALVDEHSRVFRTTRPGRLNDIFGIRVANFEETTFMNDISPLGYSGKKLRIAYPTKTIDTQTQQFEVIEPKGADVLARITSLDKAYPIITSNTYGMGRAIYVGIPVNSNVLAPLISELCDELQVRKGPKVPKGVLARQTDRNHMLYINTSAKPKTIEIKGKANSILSDKKYTDSFILEPFEPEFIELK